MPSRLHIVHTESSAGWGGQELRILTESRGMIARGHRLTLIAPAETRISAEAGKYGVETVALTIAKKRPRGVFALRRWLAANRPDVVNTHSSTDSWLAALSGWAPIVRTRHISAPVRANFANRWLYGSATRRVVTTGEFLRRHLLETLRLAPGHVVSIPTGIDLEKFDRSKTRSARPELGIPADALVFGIVATLRSWKGHQQLLDAFEKLPVKTHLVIAGDGPQRAPIESRIAGSGLRSRIHFLGHRDDVPELLAAMDCFVLPSYANEGVPQAIVQAMAMELPVVSTRVGAIDEAVRDGETGILLPAKDPAALAAAMRSLAENSSKRNEFGAAGRRLAEREFSLERMLASMEAVFYAAASSR